MSASGPTASTSHVYAVAEGKPRPADARSGTLVEVPVVTIKYWGFPGATGENNTRWTPPTNGVHEKVLAVLIPVAPLMGSVASGAAGTVTLTPVAPGASPA